MSSAFDPLGRDFVDWQFARLAASGNLVLPGPDAAWAGFGVLGHRPEDLLKAVRLLQGQTGKQGPPDETFAIICTTLAASAADVELNAIDDLGDLARAVFGRIAAGSTEGIKGVYTADALAQYAAATGTSVEASQVQSIVQRLIDGNLVIRPAHGTYAVADPFVQQVWLERAGLRALASSGSATDPASTRASVRQTDTRSND